MCLKEPVPQSVFERKAYAILDGGGVKGAALAGCLKAAEERELKFVGYGGTSAGAIVALLATVGYNGDELERITVDEIEFTSFLDDGGIALNELKALGTSLSDAWRAANGFGSRLQAASITARSTFKHRQVLGRLLKQLGLYNADNLKAFLQRKIMEKIPALRGKELITFQDLADHGCPRLRIVSADLRTRCARIHSIEKCAGYSVINAVRMSMGYPFVFRPVECDGNRQVDGGISSNLPISIFETERIADQLPVVAFDLVASAKKPTEPYSLGQFCGDMMATALESGEHLILDIMSGVHHVRVVVPEGIDTLDFAISRQRRAQLFTTGVATTHSYFSKVPQWQQAKTIAQWVQAQYAPPRLVTPILRSVANDFEANSSARDVRTAVILPTGHGTQLFTYTYNQEEDADSDLEFDLDSKGFADDIVYLDLEKTVLATLWGLTREQNNKLRRDRKAIMHFPIFDRPLANSIGIKRSVNGLLSIDTSTSGRELEWMSSRREPIIRMGQLWAEVLAKLLLRTY